LGWKFIYGKATGRWRLATGCLFGEYWLLAIGSWLSSDKELGIQTVYQKSIRIFNISSIRNHRLLGNEFNLSMEAASRQLQAAPDYP